MPLNILDLAQELRAKVWDEVVSVEANLCFKDSIQPQSAARDHRSRLTWNISPALLLVNKQIHKEALGRCYKINALVTSILNNDIFLWDVVAKVIPMKLGQIRDPI